MNKIQPENKDIVQIVCTNDLSSLMNMHFSPRSLIYDINFSTDGKSKKKFLLERINLSLLHISAFFGSIDVFIYLVQMYMDTFKALHIETPVFKDIPLSYALYGKNIDIVAYILSLEPECWKIPNGQPNFRLLHLATINIFKNLSIIQNEESLQTMLSNPLCKCSSEPLLQLLLHYNFPFHQIIPKDIKQTMQEAINSHDIQVLHFYAKYFNIHEKMKGISLLSIAINADFADAIQPLIDYGFDPLEVIDGKTALFYACSNSSVECVKVLCDQYNYGREVDVPLFQAGTTAIYCALYSQNPDIVNLILQTNPNLYRIDPNLGKSSFIINNLIVFDDNIVFQKVLQALILAGFDINVRLSGDSTLLYHLIFECPIQRNKSNSTLDRIKILLRNGADPNTAEYPSSVSICSLRDLQKLPSELIHLFDKYETIQPPIQHLIIPYFPNDYEK